MLGSRPTRVGVQANTCWGPHRRCGKRFAGATTPDGGDALASRPRRTGTDSDDTSLASPCILTSSTSHPLRASHTSSTYRLAKRMRLRAREQVSAKARPGPERTTAPSHHRCRCGRANAASSPACAHRARTRAPACELGENTSYRFRLRSRFCTPGYPTHHGAGRGAGPARSKRQRKRERRRRTTPWLVILHMPDDGATGRRASDVSPRGQALRA